MAHLQHITTHLTDSTVRLICKCRADSWDNFIVKITNMKTILIVCKGNICRSPLAHGLLDKKVNAAGLPWVIDSAGTGHWHIGKLPDSRSIKVADQHGLDIRYQRARQFDVEDFDKFDTIYVMDRQNMEVVSNLSRSQSDLDKVELIMSVISPTQEVVVPDPFHNGQENFERVYEVLDMVTDQIVAKAL